MVGSMMATRHPATSPALGTSWKHSGNGWPTTEMNRNLPPLTATNGLCEGRATRCPTLRTLGARSLIPQNTWKGSWILCPTSGYLVTGQPICENCDEMPVGQRGNNGTNSHEQQHERIDFHAITAIFRTIQRNFIIDHIC